MNILKLKNVNEKEIVYEYQPEGKGDVGIILYDTNKCFAYVVKQASKSETDDVYSSKAIFMIEDFIQHKNLPMEYTQAWY